MKLPFLRRRDPTPTAAPAPARRTVEWIDPAAVMRLKSLELRARTAVDGFLSGLHKSPIHGQSIEFSEYRAYSAGDDPRHIDWKLFARSDRTYIRRFEAEHSRPCRLVLDLSRSMAFGSGEWTKADYARTVAATLAWFLNRQRDAIGLTIFDGSVRDEIPPLVRQGHLVRLLASLSRDVDGRATDAALPLKRLADRTSRRGLVILISDLLVDADELAAALALLRARRQELLVLQTLDPAELTLDFHEPLILEDLESRRLVAIEPAAVRDAYRKRFDAHRARIRNACQTAGATLHELHTDRPIADALHALIASKVAGTLRVPSTPSASGGTPR